MNAAAQGQYKEGKEYWAMTEPSGTPTDTWMTNKRPNLQSWMKETVQKYKKTRQSSARGGRDGILAFKKQISDNLICVCL